jgi:recombination protein RecR
VRTIASPIATLINELSKLPTIGPKTAARLVFHLLNRPRHEAQSLAEAILAVKDNVGFCSICYCLSEQDPCEFCTDDERDRATICVVAEAKDVYAI